MKQFKSVIKFEYLGYARANGFIFTTIFFVLVIAVLTNLPAIMGLFNRGTDSTPETAPAIVSGDFRKAMIYDPSGIYTNETISEYMPEFEWQHTNNFAGAEEAVASGEFEFALLIDGNYYRMYEQGSNMFTQSNAHAVRNMITRVNQVKMLQDQGLTAKESHSVLLFHPIGEVITVGTDYSQTFWIGYVMIFMMYFALMFYGQIIGTSVAIEKSSKAMELLITSAKPFQLMLGKVFGVGFAGLTQLALILLTALISFRLNQAGWQEFNPMIAAILDTSMTPDLVGLALLFFVLGFFSLAFLYAGFASTISRMEELGSVITIPTILVMAAFFVGMAGAMNPHAAFVTVCSYVPFISPTVMFMRICVTDVAAWEILLACAVNAATVMGAGFVCSRIYRVGVMLYGRKPRVRDIIKYAFK